jgi:hypothetical protein
VCTGAEDGESALKLAARTAMDDYQGTGLRCNALQHALPLPQNATETGALETGAFFSIGLCT